MSLSKSHKERMSSNDVDSLQGKVAIVTGSSSGLGEAIVVKLASLGAQVTVSGRSEENVLRVASVCEQVSPNSIRPFTVVGDVKDQSTLDRLITGTVDHFGRLDVLVNNAGGSRPATFDDPNELMLSFDYAFNLNVRSVTYLCALAAKHLEQTKGCIVNISSIGSFSAFNDESTIMYSMSKAAQDMLTKCMALSHGKKGIRVNSIHPGPFPTNIYRDYSIPKEQYIAHHESYKQKSPLGRVGNPTEVADLVAFIVSDKATFFTGSQLVIDGGISIPKFE